MSKADWVKANPERHAASVKARKEKPGCFEAALFRKVRGRCRRNGMTFNLEPIDIVIPKRCPVLGIKLKIRPNSGLRYDNTPSIDRIDNRQGYVKKNIVIVSWRANRLKSDATPKELRRLAKYYGKR